MNVGGIRFDTSSFMKATKAIDANTQKNTLTFAKRLAREFEQTAKGSAPWTDQRGNARSRLYGKAEQTSGKTTIEVGGSAPNYKPYKSPTATRYPDYMELLEFANQGRYAMIYPLKDGMVATIRKEFGNAALKGPGIVRIPRDKAAARMRRKKYRQKTGR